MLYFHNGTLGYYPDYNRITTESKLRYFHSRQCDIQMCFLDNVDEYENMYECIINIYVPHEVKYLRALVKRTS